MPGSWHLNRHKGNKGAGLQLMRGDFSGKRNKGKGPEERVCLAYSKINKKASVVGEKQIRWRVSWDKRDGGKGWSGAQNMQSLIGHGKGFHFYSKWSVKQLDGLEERSDLTWPMCLKGHSSCHMENRPQGWKQDFVAVLKTWIRLWQWDPRGNVK